MPIHPKVKFKIDYKKDVKTFFAFNNEADFDDGRNLEWAIFSKYPEFKKYKRGNKLDVSQKQISKFVNSIYQKNKKIIDSNFYLYKKNWLKLEKKYFYLVDDLFDNYKWPEGKYVTYPTIWGMYPRFLEDKTFQIPFKDKKKKDINVIIAHEMLHFMFYDYFYKKYPKYKSNNYNFFVWNISEIFNSVVQNSSGWLKIFKIKPKSYPEHENIVKILEKIVYKNNNIKAEDLIKIILSTYVLFLRQSKIIF
ncbi:hypothetical protein HZB05_00385 [Candidatus Wolfebacteria bacterium]|nr:hypothetical protein [Candidatus Wolfebacteria bacterium]